MTISSDIPAEFRMSAFTAAIGVRRYARDHPGATIDEAALALQRSDGDFAGADFEAGLRLCNFLPAEIDFSDIPSSIRHALFLLIEAHRPWWLELVPYGRQRLAAALTPDELQTFRSSALYEPQPSSGVVAWWDHLAAQVRALQDERLTDQGRRAELLSFNRELDRLKNEGIVEKPIWVGLDDNGAGYDIKSYNKSSYGLTNLLIEVKSSAMFPPRIILTRGEWEAAKKYGLAYSFHVWSFPDEKLTVLSTQEVMAHIPEDCGKGQWLKVEIII